MSKVRTTVPPTDTRYLDPEEWARSDSDPIVSAQWIRRIM
jgi:hypothetical protein